MNDIQVRNRQRACRIHIPSFVRTARFLLDRDLRIPAYALGVQLLSLSDMSALNRKWLDHDGPTDVITFDHLEDDPGLNLYGEVFLCPLQARLQAQHFRVAWTTELTRHLIHGVLHLQGFDDHDPLSRSRMKRRENRLLRRLAQTIDLSRISVEP